MIPAGAMGGVPQQANIAGLPPGDREIARTVGDKLVYYSPQEGLSIETALEVVDLTKASARKTNVRLQLKSTKCGWKRQLPLKTLPLPSNTSVRSTAKGRLTKIDDQGSRIGLRHA